LRNGSLAAALVAAVLVAIVLASPPSASASRYIQLGLVDDTQILFGDPDKVFPTLKTLRTQLIRATLYWGGPNGVAEERPLNPTNPNDPAYHWATYDRTVRYAAAYGIKVLFSISATPLWANGERPTNIAPKDMLDLKRFATAAARRYNGTFLGDDGKPLPAVRLWLVWNEPNNPNFLSPQYVKKNGKWTIQSAVTYAQMCNVAVQGIHAVNSANKVACGATGPRGNNNPNSPRPSVDPLSFLVAMKNAGARGFDAYAHHPYYGRPSETPSTPPPPGIHGNAPTAVTLGNLSVLTTALKRLYGNVRLWITEYGYQVNPPDRIFGVSEAKQAAYMKQAWAIAKANPRIDMFCWFLLRDESRIGDGWQSGLMTTSGRKRPSYPTFQRLRG
jgi:hypothetical protein